VEEAETEGEVAEALDVVDEAVAVAVVGVVVAVGEEEAAA
jgi:hypothetical protein